MFRYWFILCFILFRLENHILEAITTLKEPKGSDRTAIAMYIEVYNFFFNWDVIWLPPLGFGFLVKETSSYKYSTMQKQGCITVSRLNCKGSLSYHDARYRPHWPPFSVDCKTHFATITATVMENYNINSFAFLFVAF